jgi:hypothetical protein
MSVVPLKRKNEQPDFDVSAILATATEAKTPKSKSKVPLLDVGPETQQLATEIRELRDEIESLTSICKTKESGLLNHIEGEREHVCKMGYSASIKVPDTTGHSLTISYRDQYSKVDMTNAATIKGIVGDRYEDYFTTGLEITVKDVTDAALKELIALVGPEKFARFFSVERWIKPTPRYTTEFFTAFSTEERERLSQVVRQYTPSIKTK